MIANFYSLLRTYVRNRYRLMTRGQSLVEIAILFPVLLVLLSGLLEFGFVLNEYLTLQDAVRNAARFSSDSDFTVTDGTANTAVCADSVTGFPREPCCKGRDSLTGTSYGDGQGTVDFYRQTSCAVNDELNQMAPDISLNCLAQVGPLCYWGIIDPDSGDPGAKDDIVISVFSVNKLLNGTSQIVRFGGAQGWSYAEHYIGYATRNQDSRFANDDMIARMDTNAPNTGYLLVEAFYNYDQKLKLPWITAFVPDPILLHAFTIMPLTSAEPTPTPVTSP